MSNVISQFPLDGLAEWQAHPPPCPLLGAGVAAGAGVAEGVAAGVEGVFEEVVGVSVLGAGWPAYPDFSQPPPARLKDVTEICRFIPSSAPHFGQTCSVGAENPSNFSSCSPQVPQRYSYNGMASSCIWRGLAATY